MDFHSVVGVWRIAWTIKVSFVNLVGIRSWCIAGYNLNTVIKLPFRLNAMKPLCKHYFGFHLRTCKKMNEKFFVQWRWSTYWNKIMQFELSFWILILLRKPYVVHDLKWFLKKIKNFNIERSQIIWANTNSLLSDNLYDVIETKYNRCFVRSSLLSRIN